MHTRRVRYIFVSTKLNVLEVVPTHKQHVQARRTAIDLARAPRFAAMASLRHRPASSAMMATSSPTMAALPSASLTLHQCHMFAIQVQHIPLASATPIVRLGKLAWRIDGAWMVDYVELMPTVLR